MTTIADPREPSAVENYSLGKMFVEAKISPIPDWMFGIPIFHVVYGQPIKARWHQVTGLNFCFQDTRTGLYDEQGTGKTLIAQAYIAWQAANGNKSICLMPPVLAEQFKQAFVEGFPGIGKHMRLEIYAGVKAKRQKKLAEWIKKDSWPEVLIMTYELFRQEHALFDHYTALIMDEAKCFGNPKSGISQEINSFMGEFGDKYALIMNGTAVSTNLRQAYGYIKFTSPYVYRNSMEFDSIHVEYHSMRVRIAPGPDGEERFREIRTIKKFHNLERLYQALYQRGRRVEKEEVLELPAKNLIPIRFDLSPAHAEAYENFIRTKLLILPDNSLIDGSDATKMRNNAMRAVTDARMLGVDEDSQCLAVLSEIMDSIDVSQNKLFVMCYYQNTVQKVSQFLENKGLNPAVIYGKSKDPNGNKNKFLNDPTCRVAVVNYISGGVGLNFQDVCCNVVAFEPIASPGPFEQGTDRVHRSGQRKVVNVYVFMPSGTIFPKIVATMTRRKSDNSAVVSRLQLQNELLGKVQVDWGKIEKASKADQSRLDHELEELVATLEEEEEIAQENEAARPNTTRSRKTRKVQVNAPESQPYGAIPLATGWQEL